MAVKKQNGPQALKPIRWEESDWLWLAEVAKSVGLSRSAFVKRSALAAATATANGMTPYFVSEPKATPQNTRINLFFTEGKQKLAAGGGQDAADRLRSNGEATGGATQKVPANKTKSVG